MKTRVMQKKGQKTQNKESLIMPLSEPDNTKNITGLENVNFAMALSLNGT